MVSAEGEVKVLYSGIWGGVCGNGWSQANADVVCRQLGYNGAIGATAKLKSQVHTNWYWIESVNCLGNETRLQDCSIEGLGSNNCTTGLVAMATCDSK